MKPARVVVALAVVAAGVAVLESGISFSLSPSDRQRQAEAYATRPRQAQAYATYWWSRALGTHAHNPATAILVSRFRFERLRPLRSRQDEARLRDYVEWADRPEAAGFGGGVITAKVSANDLILLRVPFARVETTARIYRDPIGYAVVDPGGAGWVRIPVTVLVSQIPMPALASGLSSKPVPAINVALAAGNRIVVIYGSDLMGPSVKVYSRAGLGQVVYDSPAQLNASVPSVDEVSVEVDGMRSDWVVVQ